MNKKVICVIANGYAEEMMASLVMDEMRLKLGKKSDDYLFIGGSLVSSGRWYQDKRFATFFSGGMSPSGGFPTRSWDGFFSDLFAGVFKGPFLLAKFIKQWLHNGLEMVIVVGDFLLLTTVIPVLKKKRIPCIFIPTAKSNYIRPHFGIEKKYIKKYASVSFPRDEITAENFREFGIRAEYLGNLMQDLLDPKADPIKSDLPIVALLPGSREESYGNLNKILAIVESIGHPIHWAFVQAPSLKPEKIAEIFKNRKWHHSAVLKNKSDQRQNTGMGLDSQVLDSNIICWTNGSHQLYAYPSYLFDNVALACIMGISLAGTVGDQIAGLGKPVLSFVGTGPQSSKARMIEYTKLLGEAFVYVKNYPSEAVDTLNDLLVNTKKRQKIGQEGFVRMGSAGGTKKIAAKIVEEFLTSEKKSRVYPNRT